MRAPAWCRALLRLLTPGDRLAEVMGDLDEAHGKRVRGRGRVVGTALTAAETLDVGRAMLLVRMRDRHRAGRSSRVPRAEGGPGIGGGSAGGASGPRFSRLDFVLGIRMALGSSRAAVIRAVFRRPLVQVLMGTGVGVLLFPALVFSTGGSYPGLGLAAFLVGYFLLMTAVCLTACIVPSLRVVRVAPADALRTEG